MERQDSLENTTSFMQHAGELRNGTLVHGVLKGTNLVCYWRSEDADTGQEPLFTIAINKVTSPTAVSHLVPRHGHLFLKALESWAQASGAGRVDSLPKSTKLHSLGCRETTSLYFPPLG